MFRGFRCFNCFKSRDWPRAGRERFDTVPVNNLTQSAALNPLALIIEDDDTLAAMFAEALRQVHFKTVVVSDGADAVAQVTALAPVLIILDLHLPHVAGDEILRQIRQDEKLTKVHVVVITADAVRAAAVQDEADLVLIKPLMSWKDFKVKEVFRDFMALTFLRLKRPCN